MNPTAISKAKGRLRVARQQLDKAAEAKDHEQFSDCWYLFLVAAKNVYTTLEKGSKASPQSRQWFGGKKDERKTDPLLQYLFQARDDDEHGLGDVTRLDTGYLAIGRNSPGFSNSMSLSINIDSDGNTTIHRAESHDGKPILIERKGPHSVLLPVTGRGHIIYHPPRKHLGKDLPDNLPITVAELGMAYLEALVSEADARAA